MANDAVDAVLNVLEESADAIDQTLDAIEAPVEWSCDLNAKQHLVQFALVGALAGGAAAALTYFVVKRQLTTKYEAILEKEIAEAKEFYSVLHKRDELSTPEKAVSKLMPVPKVKEASDALLTYQGKDDKKPVVVEEATVVNVFEQSQVDDEFDLEEEIKSRTPDAPYVISEEEYMQNETEFSQTTLTYYAGDGALADEQDREIPYADPIIGEANLERFGHGTGDANTVFIRNERLSAEYEVVRSDGKFAHEVLGLEHSDGGYQGRDRGGRRFRGGGE